MQSKNHQIPKKLRNSPSNEAGTQASIHQRSDFLSKIAWTAPSPIGNMYNSTLLANGTNCPMENSATAVAPCATAHIASRATIRTACWPTDVSLLA
jgi:hypothetical protein